MSLFDREGDNYTDSKTAIESANRLKTTILYACNNHLAAYEKDFLVLGLQFDFSSPQKSFALTNFSQHMI